MEKTPLQSPLMLKVCQYHTLKVELILDTIVGNCHFTITCHFATCCNDIVVSDNLATIYADYFCSEAQMKFDVGTKNGKTLMVMSLTLSLKRNPN